MQAYFAVLQSNPTAEEMRAVVTDDFETGFADGYKWRGPDGLRDFLAAPGRSVPAANTAGPAA